MAALSAERAVPIRCAFGLAGSGIEFDDIDCFLSWLFTTRQGKPVLRSGGVNGLHGHSARAPVDDAGRAGRMSGEAEQPSEGPSQVSRQDRSTAAKQGGTGYALPGAVDGVSDSPVAWSLESRHG